MMRKSSVCCLFALVLLGSLALTDSDQTSNEILGKMIEAMGGRKVLENIKDMTVSAAVNVIQMGIEAKVTNSIKEPNLSRVDIEMSGAVMSQKFDGEKAWMIDSRKGIEEQLPEAAQKYAKRDALGFSSLLNPDKFGIIYTYTGKERIENKEYLVVEREYENGYITTNYLDPETYLLFKSVATALDSKMMEVEEETRTSDYRKIGGVMIAHSVTVYQDGQKYMTSTVTDVKFNTGLADSLFKKRN
jgi:outer membrane lipoprotein-sorting protein